LGDQCALPVKKKQKSVWSDEWRPRLLFPTFAEPYTETGMQSLFVQIRTLVTYVFMFDRPPLVYGMAIIDCGLIMEMQQWNSLHQAINLQPLSLFQ
jgi:hypothetical protein